MRSWLPWMAFAALAAQAQAGDFYVDVAHGNDANAGNAPGSAWRTLTHASTATPAGDTNTIHVAPGTYSAASGETFPLHFQLQHVIGDQGPSVTILDGGGGAVLIEMLSPRGSGTPTSAIEVRGLTLQNATTGIGVSASWNNLSPVLADLRITGMSAAGIQGGGFGVGPSGGGTVDLTLDHVAIEGCANGVTFTVNWGTSLILATDCSIRGSSGAGIGFTSFANTLGVFTRCRIESNSGPGVSGNASNYGVIQSRFEDCLLDHNAAGFDAAPTSGLAVNITANFLRCTIADNAGAGVRVLGPDLQVYGAASFYSTLVRGNSPDIDVSHTTSTAYAQIGGPDPLFVNPAAGDYRLRFGSPCIDVGDPVAPIGTLDLAGNARPIDGDLDTHERADIGAYEHAPLFLVTTGHLGAPLALELWGPSGGTTTVYFSRLAPVAPMSTPFGEFDLDPVVHGTLFTSAVAPGPPFVFHRPIPNNPLLVGRTFSFQALTSSSLAPQGFAYTNVVAVTITP